MPKKAWTQVEVENLLGSFFNIGCGEKCNLRKILPKFVEGVWKNYIKQYKPVFQTLNGVLGCH